MRPPWRSIDTLRTWCAPDGASKRWPTWRTWHASIRENRCSTRGWPRPIGPPAARPMPSPSTTLWARSNSTPARSAMPFTPFAPSSPWNRPAWTAIRNCCAISRPPNDGGRPAGAAMLNTLLGDFASYIQRLNWLSVLDLLLVTAVLFVLLRLLRGTRAVVLLRGMVVLVAVLALLTSLVLLPGFTWLLRTSLPALLIDRKSTRLNSSHGSI